MGDVLSELTNWISQSWLREQVLYLLFNVPGLPPLVQSVHLLAVAMLMASIGLISMRVLNLAVPGQQLGEMVGRLAGWFMTSIVLLIVSGLPFVIARPERYFSNPVFAAKALAVLVLGIGAMWFLSHLRQQVKVVEVTRRLLIRTRIFALCLLVLLVFALFAGRWIAYVDYLY